MAEIYNPLKFFGVAGIFMLGLALLLGIGPVVHYLRYRAVPLSEIYRLLTILVLVVSGLNVLLSARITYRVAREFFRPFRDRQPIAKVGYTIFVYRLE